MIYGHQRKAIEFITEKFQSDPQAEALLLSGSIAHGFNSETSDVDINIVVSGEVYARKEAANALTYWENGDSFMKGFYFDGKYITLGYLALAAERGSEPTRFALHDARVLFDRTGQVAGLLKQIGTYQTENLQSNAVRFVSQLDIWNWYCSEALKRNDRYLLDVTVSKLILFAGRLILLDNRVFFPYHKWLMRVLEKAKNKPDGFMAAIHRLLEDKSAENIKTLYEMTKNHKDWTEGAAYSHSSHFTTDTETVWMRQDEFIENL